MRLNRANA